MIQSVRPFRFGITTASATSKREWVEKARRIESLGYSTLTIPDHFPDRLAAVPALMSVADATTTLRVASWVFCNDFRHPALLYKEAATIDLLSEGRFELGIGAGWLKTEYDMTGLAFDSPAVRVARMEEAVHVIKALAAEGPVTFQGEHYQITGLEGAPKSVQKPHPPLYIGGGGKRLLTFAAREADIVGFGAKALPEGGLDIPDISAASVRRKLGWVREAASAAGRDPELNILIFIVEITDDRPAAAKRLAGELPGVSESVILESPHVLLGTVEEITDQLVCRREEYGFTYIVINTGVSEHIEQIAPVISLVSGK